MFPCGSVSTIKTFFPRSARSLARVNVVVVFPTPPFWLAIVSLNIRLTSPLHATLRELRYQRQLVRMPGPIPRARAHYRFRDETLCNPLVERLPCHPIKVGNRPDRKVLHPW